MDISYEWTPSSFIQGNEYYENLIDECAHLYSTQYGKWSKESPYNAGKRIKLSAKRIYEWLDDDNTAIYWAKNGNMLVGYAIAIQLDVPRYGIISWVTQLVVHEEYRHKDIAKKLLHSIWGFTDNFAWGIVSANPYAIRALEKTTRRRSDPKRIKHNLRKLISLGIEHLPYINANTETFVTNEVSKINTQFYVDHSDVEEMIENVVTDTVPWTLGKLDEGWEWLAFTFRDQLPFELTEKEIMTMLKASDQVVHNAYKRMNISEAQSWTANTEKEVEFILRECELESGHTLIDFGCGQGRHALEMAHRGIKSIGVDYVEKNIEIANRHKDERNAEETLFYTGDCRTIDIGTTADAAICLYDVIGTYAENDENLKILKNIAKHLKRGGVALISVMNYHLTYDQAKYTFVLRENPNALLQLKPSNIMETTGNVFNPDYYLVDTESGVVYRREQFKQGRSLPIEHIVRDKRFTKSEIEMMCTEAGFDVIFSRFVNARDWETGFNSVDKSAKEILLKCKKR